MKEQNGKCVKILCHKCLKQVVGYKDENGLIKVTCPYCGTKMVSKRINRRQIEIKLIAPKGMELTTEN